MSNIRLTEKRLDIIIGALAYYEDYIRDGESVLWETEAEYNRLEHERAKAFVWAHQELNKRKARTKDK